MHDVESLRDRFQIDGVAEIQRGPGDLPVVRVTSPTAAGEMFLHGGHVTSWAPAGVDEVLFVSRKARFEAGRAIRGGIPVCFPWFGPLGGRPDAPAHGFARTNAWQLDALEQTRAGVAVDMSLVSNGETRAYWPADFRLTSRVTFGTSLTVELTVVNTGTKSFAFEEALHTYYHVGAISSLRVRGLEGARYLDALDNHREHTQQGVIDFTSEVDRVYLDPAALTVIEDLALRRRLRVSATHARTAVVWNPWIAKTRALADLDDEEWRAFVCVETCNIAPRPVHLEPGAAHMMRLEIAVDVD